MTISTESETAIAPDEDNRSVADEDLTSPPPLPDKPSEDIPQTSDIDSCAGADGISAWLESQGLGKYIERFLEHELDLETVCYLTNDDLKELELPIGPRKKILAAVAQMDNPDQTKEMASWYFVASESSEEELRRHIDAYPSGVTEKVAKQLLEDMVWTNLASPPSAQALEAFLEEFPDGNKSLAAKNLLSLLDQEAVRDTPTDQHNQDSESLDCDDDYEAIDHVSTESDESNPPPRFLTSPARSVKTLEEGDEAPTSGTAASPSHESEARSDVDRQPNAPVRNNKFDRIKARYIRKIKFMAERQKRLAFYMPVGLLIGLVIALVFAVYVYSTSNLDGDLFAIRPNAGAVSAQPPKSGSQTSPGRQVPDAMTIETARFLIKNGKMEDGREILAKLASRGNAGAIFTLAESYDPNVLTRWGASGAKAEPEKAKIFYSMALSQGVEAAIVRLTALENKHSLETTSKGRVPTEASPQPAKAPTQQPAAPEEQNVSQELKSAEKIARLASQYGNCLISSNQEACGEILEDTDITKDERIRIQAGLRNPETGNKTTGDAISELVQQCESGAVASCHKAYNVLGPAADNYEYVDRIKAALMHHIGKRKVTQSSNVSHETQKDTGASIVARPAPKAGENKPAPSAAPASSVVVNRPAPGTTFKDCDVCPEMVVVPAGSFMMGSNTGDADEKPVHKVTIAKPFAVGKFEVTFAEWDACVADGGCNHKPGDAGWGRGKRPVINVSWDDITKQYLPWLSRKTGKTYRLLSEAEWEYAARAGRTWREEFGDTIWKSQAQFREGSTVSVGSFKPNASGLYDMHGNVWEWVQDCYQSSYRGAPTDGSAVTNGNCNRRVLRGGSWFDFPQGLRSAIRYKSFPVYRFNHFGFRVVRVLTP